LLLFLEKEGNTPRQVFFWGQLQTPWFRFAEGLGCNIFYGLELACSRQLPFLNKNFASFLENEYNLTERKKNIRDLSKKKKKKKSTPRLRLRPVVIYCVACFQSRKNTFACAGDKG
jgi:hypothetical protein